MAKQSASSSKSKLSARAWSDKKKAKVLEYAETHGVLKAAKHYKVSDVTIYGWRSRAKKSGATAKGGAAPEAAAPAAKGNMGLRVLAKQLRRAISTKSVDNLGDIELTALLLVKEILK